MTSTTYGSTSNPDTDACMTVINDNSYSINVKETPHNMALNFISGPVDPGSSRGKYISASAHEGQSSFDLAFTSGSGTNDTYSVNIGRPGGTEITAFKFSPNGSSSAILAPGAPAEPGVDYNFYFFCGPAILTPLINGIISTNLAAISKWIASNPIQLSLPHGISFSISSIPTYVYCSYAAVSVLNTNPNTIADRFNVNLIMNMTGEVSGEMKSPVVPSGGSYGVKVQNLAVYVSLTVDTSDSSKPVVEVTTFQVSMDSYDLSGVIGTILKSIPFFQIILRLADAYHTAGAINSNSASEVTTDCNKDIIHAINTAIGDKLSKSTDLVDAINKVFSKRPSLESSSLREKVTPKKGAKPKLEASSYAQWMSSYQNTPFGKLVLPGTHDSATYALTDELSTIKYGDIDFLWDFNYTAPAPPSGDNPFATPIYTGPVLGSYFLDAVNRISQAQGNTILQQLQDGIRFFDLRIYYNDSDGKCYAQHGLKGPALDDIVAQVVQFLPQASTELIVLAISHTNFTKYTKAVPSASLSLAKIPRANLYLPPGAQGVKNFDLNTIASTTIGEMIANTGSKVMVLNISSPGDPVAVFPDIAINTTTYANATPSNASPWPQGLNMLSTAQELEMGDIIATVLLGLTQPTNKDMVLRDFAYMNNRFDVTDQRTNYPLMYIVMYSGMFNVLTFDWYQDSNVYNPVDFVLDINAHTINPKGWGTR